MKRLPAPTIIALATLLGTVGEASACATCFGAPGSDLSESATKAILFMLGVIGSVLSGIIVFIWNVQRRTKQISTTT